MKQSCIFLFFSLIFLSTTVAQPITKSSGDKLLRAAELAVEENDYYTALDNYKEYYKEKGDRDVNIQYKIADLQLKLRDYPDAERTYKRIVNKRSRRGSVNPYMPQARYEYAKLLKLNGKYDEAIQELQLYISEAEDIEKIKLAKIELTGIELAKETDPVKGISIENAGPNVNSKYFEYSPVLLTEDEIYFTAIRSKSIVETSDEEKAFAKIFTSKRQGEDGWTKAAPIEGPNLNRPGYHISHLTFSPDKKIMYFTRGRTEGHIVVENKLYMSIRGADEWGAAQEVTSINGDYQVRQPTFGELFGKEVLIFSSDMDGGYGKFDLYYANREGEGFGQPINMGNVINTIGDEETPHYVQGKLYFSSNAHPGLGGYDIFSSTWNGSEWSTPDNIGQPYNSSADDRYFTIDKDGYAGALASNRAGISSVVGKTCCEDIFIIQRENLVLDLLTRSFTDDKPLNGVKVVLMQIENDAVESFDQRTKEKAHEYSFLLKKDKSYKAVASKEGYFPDSLTFTTLDLRKSQTIEKRFDLEQVPVVVKEPEYITISSEEPIRMNNIYYDFDDDKILKDAEQDLSFLLNLLNEYPDMVIELSSHTDSQGTKPYNEKLSQRRANSAKTWLTSRGITDERIQAVGYGESKILNRCVNGIRCDDEEHRFNRRTEFKIVSGPTSIKIEKKVLDKATGKEVDPNSIEKKK